MFKGKKVSKVMAFLLIFAITITSIPVKGYGSEETLKTGIITQEIIEEDLGKIDNKSEEENKGESRDESSDYKEIDEEKKELYFLTDAVSESSNITTFNKYSTLPKNVKIRVEFLNENYILPVVIDIDEYKTLEEYGVSGSPEDNGFISPAHILAEAMVKLGENTDKISIQGNYIDNIDGKIKLGEYFVFRVNGEMPVTDEGMTWYSITDYPVKDNDEIVLYLITWPSGPYAFFEEDEYKTTVNTNIEVKLLGDYSQDYIKDIKEVEGAKILISSDGGTSFKETEYETDSEGIVNLTFEEAGTYIITGELSDKEEPPMSRPFATIEVTEGDFEEDEEAVSLDKEWLEIPEALNGTDIRSDKVTLYRKGENNTIITWKTNSNAIDAEGNVKRTAEDVDVLVTATIKKGSATKTKEFNLIVKGNSDLEDSILLNNFIKNKLKSGSYKPAPISGIDSNIVELFQKDIENYGSKDIKVAMKSTDEPDYININGDITYFSDFESFIKVKQVRPVFTLSLRNIKMDYEPNLAVVLGLDVDIAKSKMQSEEVNKTTWDLIKKDNIKINEVISDLDLPKEIKAIDKKWSTITWVSSDKDIIEIVEKPTVGDDFYPGYKGVVKRPYGEDKEVILTATYEFRLIAGVTLEKTFKVTVKKNEPQAEAEIRNELKQALESGYNINNIKDFTSNEAIDPNSIIWDIQMPTSKNGGFTVGTIKPGQIGAKFTSSDEGILKFNGYRAYIYRPLWTEGEREVKLTVTLTKNGISENRDIMLIVKPLEYSEVEKEIELMEEVKSNLFTYINNGTNADKDNITKDLKTFREVYYNTDNSIGISFSFADDKSIGIKPVDLYPDNDPLEGDVLFESSNKNVIDNFLRINRGDIDKTANIKTCLSSIKFARYIEIYPENPELQKINRQTANVDIIVKKADTNSLGLRLSTLSIAGNLPAIDAGEVNFAFDPDTFNYTLLMDKKFTRLGITADSEQSEASLKINNSNTAFNSTRNVALGSFCSKEIPIEISLNGETAKYQVFVASKPYIIENLNTLPNPDIAQNSEIISNETMISRLYNQWKPLSNEQKLEVDSENKIEKLYDKLIPAKVSEYFNLNYKNSDAIKNDLNGANIDFDNVSEVKLRLKKESGYSPIYKSEWKTSDENIIKIEETTYSDYGIVNRKLTETKEVKLTLKLTNIADPKITGTKEFTLKVVPISESEKNQAETILLKAYDETSLIYGLGENESNIKTAFTLKLPESIEVVSAIEKTKWVSNNSDIIKINTDWQGNTTGVSITRPELFTPNINVEIKAIFTHKNTGLTREKIFNLKVIALEDTEVSKALEKMNYVKNNLAENIKGESTSLEEISYDLISIKSVKIEEDTYTWLTDTSGDLQVKWVSSSSEDYISGKSHDQSPLNLLKRPAEGEGDKDITLKAEVSYPKYNNIFEPISERINLSVKEYDTSLKKVKFNRNVNVSLIKGKYNYEILTENKLEDITISGEPSFDKATLTINSLPTGSNEERQISLTGFDEIDVKITDKLNYISKNSTYNYKIASKEYFNNIASSLPEADSDILLQETSITKVYNEIKSLSKDLQNQITSKDKIIAVYEKLLALKKEKEEIDVKNELLALLETANYVEPIVYTASDTKLSVTKNINLKKEGSFSNYEIKWTSNSDLLQINEGYSTITGITNRPNYTLGDKTVTLTLVLSKKNTDIKVTKDYEITVKALEENETNTAISEVNTEIEKISINNISDIPADFNNVDGNLLIKGNTNTSDFTATWESSDESLGKKGIVNFGKSAILISKPYFEEGNKPLKMTLTVKKNNTDIKVSKDFEFNVLPFDAVTSGIIKDELNNGLLECIIVDANGVDFDPLNVTNKQLKLMLPLDQAKVKGDWATDNTEVISTPSGGSFKLATVTRKATGGTQIVNLTVDLTHVASGKTINKTFTLNIPEKNQGEFDQVKLQMNHIANDLANGIKGKNDDISNVYYDLNKVSKVSINGDGSINYTPSAVSYPYSVEWAFENPSDSAILNLLNFNVFFRPKANSADRVINLKATITAKNYTIGEVPKETITIPVTIKKLSSDISNVKVNGGDLTAFNPNTYSYTVNALLTDVMATINISADPATALKVNGVDIEANKDIYVNLNSDSNTVVEIKSKVSGESEAKVYRITFVKVTNEVEQNVKKALKEANDYLLKEKIQHWTVATFYLNTEYSHKIPANYPEIYKDELDSLLKGQDKGDNINITEIQKIAIAIGATGEDARHVWGNDLIKRIYNPGTNNKGKDYVELQGVNAMIFALIAFDSRDYQIPLDAKWTRDKLIAEIISKQLPDGGFKYNGVGSNVDMTAMAINALAPYVSSKPEVAVSVNKALNCLSQMQMQDGTFGNSEATSQVIIALYKADVNVFTDNRFIKDRNIVEALLLYKKGEGFARVLGGNINKESTLQSSEALSQIVAGYSNNQKLYIYNKAQTDTKSAIKEALSVKINRAKTITKSNYDAKKYEHMKNMIGEAEGVIGTGNIEVLRSAYLKLSDAIYSLGTSGNNGNGNNGKPEEKSKTARLTIETRESDNKTHYEGMEVNISDEGTAYDVLEEFIGNNNVKTNSSKNYISAIYLGGRWYEEFDEGSLSGWVYSINGIFPEESAMEYIVNEGDTVMWKYTSDGSKLNKVAGSSGSFENSLKVESYLNKDKISVVEIDETNIEEFKEKLSSAEKSKDYKLNININTKAESNGIILKLSEEATLLLSESRKEIVLYITSPLGNVTISKNALKESIEGENRKDISVSIKYLDIKTLELSNEIKNYIGERPVFEVKIMAGDKEITDFNDEEIIISVPYIYKENEKEDLLKILYIKNKTEAIEMEESKYIKDENLMEFKTNHLSVFSIICKEEGKSEEILKPIAPIKINQMKYEDVSTEHWAWDYIYHLVSEGIMVGTGESKFEPEREITRAEFVTILAKISGDNLSDKKSKFTDVDENSWCSAFVTWANKNNITTGVSEDEFAPNAKISRQDMAKMICNYLNYKEIEIVRNNVGVLFNDEGDITAYAKDSVIRLSEMGLIMGKGNDMFYPLDNLTRAEAATIISNMIQK